MSRFGYRKPLLDRLLKLSVQNPNGYLEWTGLLNNGYGVIKIEGRRIGAHIISWIEAGGEINENQCVLHKCDNRKCINPYHLFIGTKGDNNTDRHNKGRSRNQWTGKLNKPEPEGTGHCSEGVVA